MLEFADGDAAYAFGSSGTELDLRFVQTYRHGIAARWDQPYRFAHAVAERRSIKEAMLHAAQSDVI